MQSTLTPCIRIKAFGDACELQIPTNLWHHHIVSQIQQSLLEEAHQEGTLLKGLSI